MRSHAGCGDQTVEGLANRYPGPSSLSIEARGKGDVIKSVQLQNRELPQMSLHQSSLPVSPQPLQDLSENNVGKADRSAVLDELNAATCLRGVLLVQYVDPDAGVDRDQARPALLVARSPSHRTLPRSLRISARRWRATSSRSARSTASRLVRAPVNSWTSRMMVASMSMFVRIHITIHLVSRSHVYRGGDAGYYG